MWSGTCQGFAASCFGMLGSTTCISQMGCYWDYTLNQCSGSAESCDIISGQFSCGSQSGCSWQMGCSGVSFQSCATLLDESSCLSAGCLWN
jgi:hypothetical protein